MVNLYIIKNIQKLRKDPIEKKALNVFTHQYDSVYRKDKFVEA